MLGFGVGMIFPAKIIITKMKSTFKFDLRYYINEITLSYNLSIELTVLIALIVFFLKFCFMIFLHGIKQDLLRKLQLQYLKIYSQNILC